MKQIIISCFTLATVWASFDYTHDGYAPYFGYAHLGEEASFKNTHDFSEGLFFGHEGVTALGQQDLKNFVFSKPIVYSLNSHLTSTFEHNLISPEIPHLTPDIKTSIQTPKFFLRLTNTPVNTYEVNEDNYEPQPPPQINVSSASKSAATLALGSGSLGVVDLGDGKYTIGSGSLGLRYSNAPAQQQPTGSLQVGGLHEVPAPSLGNAQAFVGSDSRANEPELNADPEAFSSDTPYLGFNSLQHTPQDLTDFSYLKE